MFYLQHFDFVISILGTDLRHLTFTRKLNLILCINCSLCLRENHNHNSRKNKMLANKEWLKVCLQIANHLYITDTVTENKLFKAKQTL